MPKFKISATAIVWFDQEVEADNEDDAWEKARSMRELCNFDNDPALTFFDYEKRDGSIEQIDDE